MVKIISCRDIVGSEDYYDLEVDGIVYHDVPDKPSPVVVMTELPIAPRPPVKRVQGKPVEIIRRK